MVSFTIDNKTVCAPDGSNLLEAARSNGIDIPGLCYHRKLTPTGACRLCLVKIEGVKGMVTSCTVTVSEGMKVTAFDREIEETRMFLLNYLLYEHNDTWDGTYPDELRELVFRYGLDKPEKRDLKPVWEKIDFKKDDSSPVLTYDPTNHIS